MTRRLPDKLFFKIGEVADIVGVKTHILRYWESEFKELCPVKTRGLHRMYSRKDVELAVQIRRLVYEQGFTVQGARKKLRKEQTEARKKRASDVEQGEEVASTEDKVDGPPVLATQEQVQREIILKAELLAVRKELSGLLESLERQPSVETRNPPKQVTVQKATPHAQSAVKHSASLFTKERRQNQE